MRRRTHSTIALAVIVLTILGAVLSGTAAAGTSYPTAHLVLNGEPLATDVPPVIINNRTLVPARAVFEGCGATVTWLEATRSVRVEYEDRTVTVKIGSAKATVDGATVTLDVAPMIIGNRTMVPVRFIAESIGAEVGWIQATRTVTIDISAPAPEPVPVPEITKLEWIRGAGHGTLRITAGESLTDATLDTTQYGHLRVRIPGVTVASSAVLSVPAGDDIISSASVTTDADGVWIDVTLVRPVGASLAATKTGADLAIGYSVTGAGFQRNDDGDHILIQTTGMASYKLMHLTGPDRLVIDFPLAGLASSGSLTVDGAYVQQVRWARPNADTARVVLDFRAGAVPVGVQRTSDGIELTVSPRFTSPLAGTQIVLDPGHGGPGSPGACGVNGTRESFVNLDIAERARELLQAQGADVTMTRESDVTTELYSRAYLANDLGVDLFVSIHCNSLADRSVQGTMVYYYKTTDDSNRLATSIYNALIADAGRPAKGVRTDSLAVVRETTMPSVLAECAFISNPTEESLLATPEFRQQLAQGIYDGIAAYQATNSD